MTSEEEKKKSFDALAIQNNEEDKDEQKSTDTVQDVDMNWISRFGRYLRNNTKKVLILLLILGVIIYVAIDLSTNNMCTFVEGESTTKARLMCGGLTEEQITPTTCSPNMAMPIYTYNAELDSCVKESSCIESGINELVKFCRSSTENAIIGALIYSCVYIVATLFFVPGSILTISAGAAFGAALGLGWGVVLGSASVIIGASIGSILAFLMGRYLFREHILVLKAKYKLINVIDHALHTEGLKLNLLLRLTPVIPFNAFNYIMGCTDTTLKDFIIGLIGIIPGTVTYVFIGAAVAVAATGNAEMSMEIDPETGECLTEEDNTAFIVFTIVGIIALLIALTIITKVASKKFKELVEIEQQQKEMEEKENQDTNNKEEV